MAGTDEGRTWRFLAQGGIIPVWRERHAGGYRTATRTLWHRTLFGGVSASNCLVAAKTLARFFYDRASVFAATKQLDADTPPNSVRCHSVRVDVRYPPACRSRQTGIIPP